MTETKQSSDGVLGLSFSLLLASLIVADFRSLASLERMLSSSSSSSFYPTLDVDHRLSDGENGNEV